MKKMKLSLEYKIKSFLNQVGIQIILLTVAITCLFPLIWTLSASFKTNQTIFEDMSLIPRQLNFINYYIAWTKGHFGTYFFNSIFYTTIVVAGIVIIGSMAAYALARLKFPGRNFFFFLLIATMLIPVPGAIIALYLLLMKLGLANTRIGYILPLINGGLPLAIFLFKTFFERIPEDLEDAARIDGCSKFGIYWRVALPLARPAIAVVIIFNSLTVWNEYILAMLILEDDKLMPLQRGLMNFYGAHLAQWSTLMAGIVITIVPIVVLYLLMQKHIISGITAGALKG